jgi:hypothetical protein
MNVHPQGQSRRPSDSSRSSRSKNRSASFGGQLINHGAPPMRLTRSLSRHSRARSPAGGAAHGYPAIVSGTLGIGRRARRGNA